MGFGGTTRRTGGWASLSRAAPGTEEGTFWSLGLQATWLEAAGVQGDEPHPAVLSGAGGGVAGHQLDRD